MLKIIAVADNDISDFTTTLWLNNFKRENLFIIKNDANNIYELISHNFDDKPYYLIFENLKGKYPIFFENPENLLNKYKDLISDNIILEFDNLNIYLGGKNAMIKYYNKDHTVTVLNIDDNKWVSKYKFEKNKYIYEDFLNQWILVNNNNFRRIKNIHNNCEPTILIFIDGYEDFNNSPLLGYYTLTKYFYPNHLITADYNLHMKNKRSKKLLNQVLIFLLLFLLVFVIIRLLTSNKKSKKLK